MTKLIRKVFIVICGERVGRIGFDTEFSYISDDGYSSMSEEEEEDNICGVSSRWIEAEDEILRAAVDTLGFSDWKRVSEIWYDGKKTKEECQRRSMELDLSIPLRRKNQVGFFNFKRRDPSTNTSFQKYLSTRRRREMEAMEERRLFGKARSDLEIQLIHRAFIVGQRSHDKILKMNAVSSERNDLIDLTFSSLMVEMKRTRDADVENSIQSAVKAITKLPKAIAELKDEQVLTPVRNQHPPTVENLGMIENRKLTKKKEERKVLDLKSNDLPIESALFDTIETLTPLKVDNSGEDWGEFSSPLLDTAFPCLPIPTAPARHRAPKPFFLFRSKF